jgi:hypothetical protein
MRFIIFTVDREVYSATPTEQAATPHVRASVLLVFALLRLVVLRPAEFEILRKSRMHFAVLACRVAFIAIA